MAPKYVDPAPLAGGGRAGNDHVGTLIFSESATSTRNRQANRIRPRWAVSLPVARLVADYAYGEERE